MGASGQASLNFGAFPGDTYAQLDVVATGIVSASAVEGWLFPKATADHSTDEHLVEEIMVTAEFLSNDNIRIKGQATGSGSRSQNGHKLYGIFNVGWVWV